MVVVGHTGFSHRTVFAVGLSALIWLAPAHAQSPSKSGPKPGFSARTLRIRSFIDGRSWFALRGEILWIRHLEWVAPGRWESRNLPTFVNGKAWYPEWPFGEGEGLHCRCDSSLLNLEGFSVPQRPMGVRLRKLEGRGEVTVVEEPRIGNGFRVVIETNDIPPSPAWYDFELSLIPR